VNPKSKELAMCERHANPPPPAAPAPSPAPPAAPPQPDYTLEECARLLSCDRSHVWRIRYELNAYNMASKKSKRAMWRVRPVDLEAFRLARQSQPVKAN
jgi:hypothetical protein